MKRRGPKFVSENLPLVESLTMEGWQSQQVHRFLVVVVTVAAIIYLSPRTGPLPGHSLFGDGSGFLQSKKISLVLRYKVVSRSDRLRNQVRIGPHSYKYRPDFLDRTIPPDPAGEYPVWNLKNLHHFPPKTEGLIVVNSKFWSPKIYVVHEDIYVST